MHDQPRYKPLAATDFFADHRSARPEVEGTIARGHLRIDEARYIGKIDGEDITEFPIPIAKADIERGQERFNIYCAPCHSRIGDGNGMVVLQRLTGRPLPSTATKLMNATVGHFFDVISNGFGAMPSYASRITPDDRWRVIAYIRALQLSESARLNDVPADQRQNLPVEAASARVCSAGQSRAVRARQFRSPAMTPQKHFVRKWIACSATRWSSVWSRWRPAVFGLFAKRSALLAIVFVRVYF